MTPPDVDFRKEASPPQPPSICTTSAGSASETKHEHCRNRLYLQTFFACISSSLHGTAQVLLMPMSTQSWGRKFGLASLRRSLVPFLSTSIRWAGYACWIISSLALFQPPCMVHKLLALLRCFLFGFSSQAVALAPHPCGDGR